MLGKLQQRERKLFYGDIDLEERIPANHPLRRISEKVDFSFVRPLVAPLYGNRGNPSLDPVVTAKLCLLCVLENVSSERQLMCQLPYRLDWLWFCEMDLDATIPNHSVLSKARRRWGIELFEAIFNRVLECCQSEGLIDGSVLHVDSTLLKASASKSGRISRKLWHQLEQGLPSSQEEDPPDMPSGPSERGDRSFEPCDSQAQSLPEAPGGSLNRHLVSPTDPDAATFSRRGYGTILGYRDHRLVDDQDGIIVATMATPADYDDGSMLPVLLKENRSKSTEQPEAVVGDSMYGTHANYADLSAQGIEAYLKKRRGKDSAKTSWIDELPKLCSRGCARYLMRRRKAICEGRFADAHERHNHRRCRWRRRWRVQIQCYLVATAQNLRKLIRLRPDRSKGIPNRMALTKPLLRHLDPESTLKRTWGGIFDQTTWLNIVRMKLQPMCPMG